MNAVSVTRSARALPIAAAFCIAMAFAQAWAGWEQSYKDGRAAYENAEFGKAVKFFRDAIADRPDEKANAIKTSGMFFEPYLPHYYLGMSLFQRKEFGEALAELNKSESMKVVQKFKDAHTQLRQTKGMAEAAAAAQPPPAAPPPPQIASQPPAQPPAQAPAPAASQPPQQPSSGPSHPSEQPPQQKPAQGSPQPPVAAAQKPGAQPPAPQLARPVPLSPPPSEPVKPAAPAGPDPALARAIDAAAVDIAAAQKLAVETGRYLEEAEKKSLDALVAEIRGAQSPAAAGAKLQELKRSITDLRVKAADRKRQDEARQADLAANKALRDAVEKAAPTVREADSFLTLNSAVLQPAEAEKITSLLAAAKTGSTPAAVGKAAQELGSQIPSLRRAVAERGAAATQAARQAYARGVESYFAGRYDEAASSFEQAGSALPKEAGLQGFLGCAFYKKYLLTRGEDQRLKQQAEKAFRTAVALDRGYTLDARYFPPKVIAYFKEATARP